jgi:hypothetical protein
MMIHVHIHIPKSDYVAIEKAAKAVGQVNAEVYIERLLRKLAKDFRTTAPKAAPMKAVRGNRGRKPATT